MWRFATEGEDLARLLAEDPQGACPDPAYGQATKELTAIIENCQAALKARDEDLASWRRWIEIERAAQEKLGHGFQIHN